MPSLIMTPPLRLNKGTRQIDAYGGGGFGAPRGARKHAGLDFISIPGDLVVAPFPARIIRVGVAYSGSDLGSIHLQGVNEYAAFFAKIFYGKLLASCMRDTVILEGAPLAEAQNVAAYHNAEGRMTNHVHFELYLSNVLVNPAAYFTGR